MAVGLFAATTPTPFRLIQSSYVIPKPNPATVFFPNLRHQKSALHRTRRKLCFTVYVVMEDQKQITHLDNSAGKAPEADDSQIPIVIPSVRVAERLSRKKSERFTYLVAAVMSSFGITSMAVMAVYYRFYWQMEGGNVPMSEMLGTFALSVGAAVGMEFWARWAHKALWHASLWHMHEVSSLFDANKILGFDFLCCFSFVRNPAINERNMPRLDFYLIRAIFYFKLI
ncbi:unnamed protein product [Malus baccata var. baccata]